MTPPTLVARMGRCGCLLLLLLLSSQLLTACGTWAALGGETISIAGSIRQGRPLGPGDRVGLVLGAREAETESFLDCVLRGLQRRVPPARLVPPKEVYRLASAPDAESDVLPDVLEAEARARLAANGIRYVIFITGQTSLFPNEVGVVPGPGLLWGVAHERSSAFSADVYDTASGDFVTRARARSKGGGGAMFFLLVIPVPFFAPTESNACGAMRDALLETLAPLEAGGEP